MKSRKNWWRHNSVKNVGIGLNFFCELFSSKWTIVEIFTWIGLVEVCFLKNVGYDVILKKWWRHYAVKNVGITLILLGQLFIAALNNCDDFWREKIRLEHCFSALRHFVGFWPNCRQKKCRQWRHVGPTYISFFRPWNIQFTLVWSFKYLAHRHHP